MGGAARQRLAQAQRVLLRAAQEIAPEGMEIETFDLHDIPRYNADVEAEGDRGPVASLKQAIEEADALRSHRPSTTAGRRAC